MVSIRLHRSAARGSPRFRVEKVEKRRRQLWLSEEEGGSNDQDIQGSEEAEGRHETVQVVATPGKTLLVLRHFGWNVPRVERDIIL